jgi:putative transposase
MSRPLRLEHPGALWHVTSRGNERHDIYADDVDRERWLSELARAAEQHAWVVHAYVLMGNHYHVVVETVRPTLSRGMRQLNGVYTQGFNRRHRRVGHLFQGRFHSLLVERESYLLELARYVVLNPVRAGFVHGPGDWRWSSYRATTGEVGAPPWLQVDWTLSHFARSRQRYADFVAEGRGLPFPPRLVVRGQIYLGSAEFAAKAQARAAAVTQEPEIPQPQRQPPAVPSEEALMRLLAALGLTRDELRRYRRIRGRERSLVAYGLRRYSDATCKDVGDVLGVTPWRASALALAGERRWGSAGLDRVLRP